MQSPENQNHIVILLQNTIHVSVHRVQVGRRDEIREKCKSDREKL